jgi:hypothetical protein
MAYASNNRPLREIVSDLSAEPESSNDKAPRKVTRKQLLIGSALV